MELELRKYRFRMGILKPTRCRMPFNSIHLAFIIRKYPGVFFFFFGDHFKTAKGAIISLAVATRTIHNLFPLISFIECSKGFANSGIVLNLHLYQFAAVTNFIT